MLPGGQTIVLIPDSNKVLDHTHPALGDQKHGGKHLNVGTHGPCVRSRHEWLGWNPENVAELTNFVLIVGTHGPYFPTII